MKHRTGCDTGQIRSEANMTGMNGIRNNEVQPLWNIDRRFVQICSAQENPQPP